MRRSCPHISTRHFFDCSSIEEFVIIASSQGISRTDCIEQSGRIGLAFRRCAIIDQGFILKTNRRVPLPIFVGCNEIAKAKVIVISSTKVICSIQIFFFFVNSIVFRYLMLCKSRLRRTTAFKCFLMNGHFRLLFFLLRRGVATRIGFRSIVVDKAFLFKLLVFLTQRFQLGDKRNRLNGFSIEQTIQFHLERRNINHSFCLAKSSTILCFIRGYIFRTRNRSCFLLGIKDDVAATCSNTQINKQQALGTTFIEGFGHFVKEWIDIKGGIELAHVEISKIGFQRFRDSTTFVGALALFVGPSIGFVTSLYVFFFFLPTSLLFLSSFGTIQIRQYLVGCQVNIIDTIGVNLDRGIQSAACLCEIDAMSLSFVLFIID
mmetsp:Transcript_28039/g.50765  ORF Transcript_28039/g.50765 Transcript_28039/m.50765 type:complete len:376 (-) Transcript_28039:35-1162(-)